MVPGEVGIPPGLTGNPEVGYHPPEGDLVSSRIHYPALQACWQNAHVGNLSVADFIAQRGYYIQVYNEVDFAHEWDEEPVDPNTQTSLFTDTNGDGYKEFQGDYYLLGHWSCSLGVYGFPYLLRPTGSLVRKEVIDGVTYYFYDFHKLRIPAVIPPIGTGDEGKIRDYINGCLDSLHKLPIPDYPVMGGYYSPVYGPPALVYSLHAYAPCNSWGFDAAGKIIQDVEVVRRALDDWNSSNKFDSPIPIAITEFGCAQVGATPTRVQQMNFYNTLSSRLQVSALAWWVYAGRQCHRPDDPALGRNEPDDWDRMAVVDYRGRVCDVETSK